MKHEMLILMKLFEKLKLIKENINSNGIDMPQKYLLLLYIRKKESYHDIFLT